MPGLAGTVAGIGPAFKTIGQSGSFEQGNIPRPVDDSL